jgi:hypothetical protein
MRVLVCGSRSWDDAAEIAEALKRLPRGSTVIHGGARGADQLAGTVAAKLGFEVEVYPADWSAYGKRAGFIRNMEMIDTQPDRVVAFWDGRSTGTKHTLDLARRAEIEVEIHLP